MSHDAAPTWFWIIAAVAIAVIAMALAVGVYTYRQAACVDIAVNEVSRDASVACMERLR